MQNTIIMAFRKRLKNRGYKNVSIKIIKEGENKGKYIVTAEEPLSYTNITKICDEYFMNTKFKEETKK